MFDQPAQKPLVLCASFGAHEGLDVDRTWGSSWWGPAGIGLGKPLATVMGFVDGHVKYVRAGFWDFCAIMYQTNEAGATYPPYPIGKQWNN
jgi:hypothetical protein